MAGPVDDGEGEAGLGGGEVGFFFGEDEAAGEAGVAADEPGEASGGDDADGVEAAVEGVLAAGLVEVADELDGAVVLGGEVGERGEGASGVVLAREVEAGAEESGEGVEDEEAGAMAGEGVVELGEVAREAEPGFAGVVLPDGDAVEVGAGGGKAGVDELAGAVLGVEDEDVGGGGAGSGLGYGTRSAPATGEFAAGGDAGGDVEGEDGFADARVAVEEGDVAEGKVSGPEPFDGLGGEVGEGEEGHGFAG